MNAKIIEALRLKPKNELVFFAKHLKYQNSIILNSSKDTVLKTRVWDWTVLREAEEVKCSGSVGVFL